MKATRGYPNEKRDEKSKQNNRRMDTMICEVSWIPPPQQRCIYNWIQQYNV